MLRHDVTSSRHILTSSHVLYQHFFCTNMAVQSCHVTSWRHVMFYTNISCLYKHVCTVTCHITSRHNVSSWRATSCFVKKICLCKTWRDVAWWSGVMMQHVMTNLNKNLTSSPNLSFLQMLFFFFFLRHVTSRHNHIMMFLQTFFW